jgi:hypothetical protein
MINFTAVVSFKSRDIGKDGLWYWTYYIIFIACVGGNQIQGTPCGCNANSFNNQDHAAYDVIGYQMDYGLLILIYHS